jgi:hypothetical protein
MKPFMLAIAATSLLASSMGVAATTSCPPRAALGRPTGTGLGKVTVDVVLRGRGNVGWRWSAEGPAGRDEFRSAFEQATAAAAFPGGKYAPLEALDAADAAYQKYVATGGRLASAAR